MLLIIGGGLAGGLLSLALKKNGFENFYLVDSAKTFGGHHTWSFHGQDLPAELAAVLWPALKASWPSHDIMMPSYRRTIAKTYHSLRGEDFHKLLVNTLSPNQYLLGSEVDTLGYELCVDTRPIPLEQLGPVAFQNFVGLDLYFPEGHGLTTPRLMDATVNQKNGYRFIYCLPWDNHNLLVEDTRYQNFSLADEHDYIQEIKSYASLNFSEDFEVRRKEVAALPLPLTSKMFSIEPNPTTLPLGIRGGVFNPTTGYSFPQAAQIAVELAKCSDVALMAQKYSDYRTEWMRRASFYCALNRMLFGAAEPNERRKIFERFYKLPEDLIHRFYQGNLKLKDQARILIGKPPVPIGKAFQSLLNDSWMDNSL